MLEVENMVTGKDLKGKTLCKILSEDLKMKGFQYKLGMNEDIHPLENMYGGYGLYFTEAKNICSYLEYGEKLAVINVPEDEPVCVYDDFTDTSFSTHRLVIEKIVDLWTVETWRFLVENGANITADKNWAIQLAARDGYFDIVHYLCEHGSGNTSNYDFALCLAASHNHLEIVKLLRENGASVTAYNNLALCKAEEKGFSDIAEYLSIETKKKEGNIRERKKRIQRIFRTRNYN